MTTMHHTVAGHVSHATTRQFTGRKTFSIALALLSLGLVLGPPAPVGAQSAWVATDSSQYLAGEMITMTGAGFGPYATVTVQVTHADGGAEPDMGHEAATFSADGDGGFWATWAIAAADRGGNDFVVQATGTMSGTVAAAFKRVARVQTDKSDYQPGETVVITGWAFEPGESVTLEVVHVTGAADSGAGHDPFSVPTDASGQLVASWFVNPDDSSGSTFLLLATGASSARTASTTFTDAVGTPPDSTADVVYGQLGSFTTGTLNKGGRSADSLWAPGDVALDNDGNLYVADTGNNRVLFYLAGSTTASRVYGQQSSFTTGTGNATGNVTADYFLGPEAVELDSGGNLYVADRNNSRVLFYPAGSTTPTRVYGQGGSFTSGLINSGGLNPNANGLSAPFGVALDSNDNLYVADAGNHRVLFYPAGSTTPTRVYGQGGDFTTGTVNNGGGLVPSADSLNTPRGVTLDRDDNLYVADRNNARVLFYPAGSTTATRVYGQGGNFTTRMAGTTATALGVPEGVALDRNGNLYVADLGNNRVLFYPAGSTAATHVYGQGGSFTTGTTNKGGLSANSLLAPKSIDLDNAGNLYVADRSNNRVLRFDGPSDAVAPTATPTQSPAANAAGWNNTDVTVTWNWTDEAGGSGIDSANCTTSSISSGEDSLISVSASCADLAGNTATASHSVNVDQTAPTISAAATTSPNAADWYRTDVTVRFTCTDMLSGISTCPADQTLSEEGAGIASSAQTATDNADNVSAPSNEVVVYIDKTPPTVSVTAGPANGGSYYFGAVPAAPACSASDALSGLDGLCTVSGYSTAPGPHTLTATAMDNAGNQSDVSATYTVLPLTLSSFYAPVDMGGVWNTVKNGATVPLKFEIFAGSAELTDITLVSSLRATPAVCTGGSADEIELLASGATSLRYDVTNGVFIYNWQTPKKSGSCLVVTVTTVDGSTQTANFKLK